MHPKYIHAETAAGWDLVARTKYDIEIEEHIRFLREGNHHLLPVELERRLPHSYSLRFRK